MSDIAVATSVQKLTDADVDSVIQNLGTGVLYVDIVDTVSTSTGLKLASGASVPVAGGRTYYGISDTSADVRVLPGGIGRPG